MTSTLDESIGNGIPQEHQVAVVGAGPSGVASALALKDRGIGSVVIDQADQVASSWRGRYDRLRLNTWRAHSHLPDRPFPKGTPKLPTRDQLIDHVESHAREDGIDLRLRTRVEAIDREEDHWAVSTGAAAITAPQVVVAIGYEGRPWIPDWEGREGFEGRSYVPRPGGLGYLAKQAKRAAKAIARELHSGQERQ
jgi:cation diffusion facilitator CzcD-associated flavoprotein CzcO